MNENQAKSYLRKEGEAECCRFVRRDKGSIHRDDERILKTRHLLARRDDRHPHRKKEIIRHDKGEDGKNEWSQVRCNEDNFVTTKRRNVDK